MKKRVFALILALSILFAVVPAAAAENDAIKVYYLGDEISFLQAPQIIGGSTMVPMRTIFETFGYTIHWDNETKTVTAENETTLITITIDSPHATVNVTDYTLDAPATLVNGSTFVPLRFIGEASGYVVSWNDADKSVHIEYSEKQKAALAELNPGFIEDLTYVKENLPKLHKNLFASISPSEFTAQMDALISGVPGLSQDEIQFKLMGIVNSVGDSHTVAAPNKTVNFPLSFFEFDDGIYLRATTAPYQDYIGKKLTGINGYTMEQVKEKLLPIIPQENEAIISSKFSGYIASATLLKDAGVINTVSNAAFQFEDKTAYITSISPSNSESSKTVVSEKYPLSILNSSQNYWYTYMEENSAIYVKYNLCYEGSVPFSDFTDEVFKKLDDTKATKLIIDLRDNGGGSSPLFDPFLKAIKDRPSINQKGHLYVIVGRKTFSSAILNAMSLKNETACVLVGEKTGGSPNHYGEIKSFSLPNLTMTVSYSTKYFQRVNADVRTITPDIEVPLKASSYFEGKDDFLEEIWKQ